MNRVFAFLLMLVAPLSGAQTSETGFLNRSVTVEGTEFRYVVYVPRDFNRATAWPILVALHGGGEYGDDGIKQTAGGVATAIRLHPERFPAIVIFPQAHADHTPGWQQKGGEAALAAVDKAIAEFHGDPARVYLTGLSAGGNGTWYIASHHAERFAALLVVSGFAGQFKGKQSGLDYPPVFPEAPDPYAAVAKKVAGLPTWIFHNDGDPNVPVDESRRMFSALKAVGANVQYIELHADQHDAWTAVYARADVWAWLFQQKKP
ncbi:conserved hypothetical protein [Candidatus Koribacter versatilis Ellin345]|uniref:Peptidase S9 prolyl oligopeptidase catalytic domain-containing protein n=1 Tax=Koribacter versatilis (strain Ellin345) TaxID=204669 RepID=Q1IPD0_KORVE|nr:PHB depolymerase family esterase [Candidatus Koribacter versatilis]ABF41270.1 conserved hypothetical protein [Candidatus Koribacter versatilis Ellin345]